MPTNPPIPPAWRNPWIQAWIGLVVTVLAMNLLMVYLAIATDPGLVNDDYYERGQQYERTLVTRAARAPDWVLHTDIPQPLQVGQAETLRVFVVDAAGQPVEAEGATLHLYRPADAGQDFSQTMVREGPGRYAATVVFPLAGVWDSLATVRAGADEIMVGQRVNVQRP